MTTTAATPSILLPDNLVALAALLGPWAYQEQPEIEKHEHRRYERGTLRYAGDDPLLTGASIEGSFDYYGRENLIHWSGNMHVPTGEHGTTYLPDLLPHDQRRAWPGGTINISANKPVARVARDLTSRLLSYYLPAYRLATEEIGRRAAQHCADVTLARQLAQILACKIQHQNGDPSTVPQLWSNAIGPMRVDHGKLYVERTFSVSATQAEALCQLIATWEK